jgi:DNA primase
LNITEDRTRFLKEAASLLAKMPDILQKRQLMPELIRLGYLDNSQEHIFKSYGQNKVSESVTVDMEEKRLNDQGMKRTPMRHAITLLLNFPQLIEHVGNPEQFARYEVAGVDLFLMLLEIIEADPTIHTAALVERFRDTPYATALARLHGLQFNYDVESDLLVREFCDCLAQIKRQAQQKQLDQLLQNEQVNGLNPQERNDLLCLLSELHNSGA